MDSKIEQTPTVAFKGFIKTEFAPPQVWRDRWEHDRTAKHWNEDAQEQTGDRLDGLRGKVPPGQPQSPLVQPVSEMALTQPFSSFQVFSSIEPMPPLFKRHLNGMHLKVSSVVLSLGYVKLTEEERVQKVIRS